MKVLGCYPGRAPEHKDPGFYIVGTVSIRVYFGLPDDHDGSMGIRSSSSCYDGWKFTGLPACILSSQPSA